jgi:hypothetical protein
MPIKLAFIASTFLLVGAALGHESERPLRLPPQTIQNHLVFEPAIPTCECEKITARLQWKDQGASDLDLHAFRMSDGCHASYVDHHPCDGIFYPYDSNQESKPEFVFVDVDCQQSDDSIRIAVSDQYLTKTLCDVEAEVTFYCDWKVLTVLPLPTHDICDFYIDHDYDYDNAYVVADISLNDCRIEPICQFGALANFLPLP